MSKTYKGLNGQITLTEAGVKIKKSKFLGDGIGKGEKSINFELISGIDFKRCGLTNGYIKVLVPGAIDNQLFKNIERDDYAVCFWAGKNKEFEELKTIIETRLLESRKGSQTNGLSIADEIKKLSDLVEKNIITAEEFEDQKRKLLSS